MSWFTKAQSNRTVQMVKAILDSSANGSIEEIRQKIQTSVGNPCMALAQLCDGQMVNPFYMNVWSSLCHQDQEEQQMNEEVVPNSESVTEEVIV